MNQPGNVIHVVSIGSKRTVEVVDEEEVANEMAINHPKANPLSMPYVSVPSPILVSAYGLQ